MATVRELAVGENMIVNGFIIPQLSLSVGSWTAHSVTAGTGVTNGSTKVYRMGNLVIVTLDFKLTATIASHANVFSGLPKPDITLYGASDKAVAWIPLTSSSGFTGRLIFTSDGNVQADSALSTGTSSNWWNGSFAYFTSAY